MRKLITRITILATLLLTIGCSTKPTMTNTATVPVNNVKSLHNWIASGKILIVENGKKESANFYWQQSGANYTFSLSTFLGIDLFSLKYKNGVAEIKTNGETFSGTDSKVLLHRLTGYNIPVEHLQNWFLGYATTANATDQTFDVNEKLQSFKYISSDYRTEQFSVPQLARIWSVEYKSRTQTKQFLLPKLISIHSDSTRIKLSISKWQY